MKKLSSTETELKKSVAYKKKLVAEEFHWQFECIGENTEKCITFSVLIQKENKNGKTVAYKIKFIGRARSVAR